MHCLMILDLETGVKSVKHVLNASKLSWVFKVLDEKEKK